MPKAKLNGINVYYEVYGAGEPLLLIAGIGGSIIDWSAQIPPLSQHLQVIAIENRGAGRSEKPEEHSMALYAADCAALLDHLGVGSAHVFGVSMGGMIAQQLTLDNPQTVRSLILGATTPCLTAWPPTATTGEAMVKALDAASAWDAFEATVRLGFSDACIAERKDDLWLLTRLQIPLMAPPEQWKKQLAAILQFDVRQRVDEIKAPTLLMHGDEDPIIPPQGTNYLPEHIAGAELIMFPGAHHAFNVEFADRCNQAVVDFLT
jgi:3-oxoadipate enol-lactonase